MKNDYKWLVMEYQGVKYAVPTTVIAKNYADYYGGKENSWQEEYDWILDDSQDFELTDWAFNNMNPEDFSGEVILIEKREPSFADVFTHCDGNYEVIVGDPRCATR